MGQADGCPGAVAFRITDFGGKVARRNLSNLRGDEGELAAFKELLKTGAAINSLVNSDTGWDLHMHLPVTPLYKMPKRTLPTNKEGWPLSGRTAHVQVKNMQSGRFPTVSVGTLRGWVSGSRSGTPTYILLIQASPKPILVIGPGEMSSWLGENEPFGVVQADKSVIQTKQLSPRPFSVYSFSMEAELAVRFPVFMLAVHDLLRPLMEVRPDTAEWADRSRELLATLAAGLMAIYRPAVGAAEGYGPLGDVFHSLGRDFYLEQDLADQTADDASDITVPFEPGLHSFDGVETLRPALYSSASQESDVHAELGGLVVLLRDYLEAVYTSPTMARKS